MNTLFIDAIFQSEYVNTLFNGETILKKIMKSVDRLVFERVILLQNGSVVDVPDEVKSINVCDLSAHSIIETIYKECGKSEICVIHSAGNPFFFMDVIKIMISDFEKYAAEYMYSIGYVDFLVPQIVSKKILPQCLELLKDNDEITEDYVFYALSKDINAFDIETVISPVDLRLARLTIGLRDGNDVLFIKSIINSCSNLTSYDEIIKYLSENPELYYTSLYAAFFNITDKCVTTPIYYPKIETNIDCNVELFRDRIIELIDINPRINIVFSGRGEPFLHPEFIKILKILVEFNKTVIIETYLQGISNEILDSFIPFRDILTIVVRKDAVHNEIYKQIHGDFNVEIVNSAIQYLKENEFKIYTQFVRMDINEDEIEYLAKVKELDKVILRKFSTFCGELVDHKVVDLSPVKRFPCYHLRRECVFSSDLSIQYCLYNPETIATNCKDGVKYYKENYIQQTKESYSNCCKECDDYYIFNF